MSREAFEAFISAPPFDLPIVRIAACGGWPEGYKQHDTDFAWRVWQAATAAALERAAVTCEQMIIESAGRSDMTTEQCAREIRALKDES